jgi:preprotein translocase subunit SecY
VAIIYVYEGQRVIPVQMSKHIRGNRVFGGNTTHVPLKMNLGRHDPAHLCL